MEIAQLISTRWSPRAFSDEPLNDAQVKSLFEAARWAPSSMNEQPWMYFYAHREDAGEFNMFIDCLLPGNQVWAKKSALIILSTTKKSFDRKGRPNRHAMHDTGAANVLLCLQANHLGYQAHQMGGFNPGKTYETFGIDSAKYDLVSFIAVGKPGDPSTLADDLKKSKTKARKRKEIKEFVNRIK